MAPRDPSSTTKAPGPTWASGAPAIWWTPPPALTSGADYGVVVARAATRDRAALRMPPLDVLPPVPAAAQPLARQMAHMGVQIEDVGGAAAEALLAADLPVELRGGLKRAMWDEVRHSELLERLDATLGADIQAPDRQLGVDVLYGVLAAAATPLEFAVVHVLLEAQAGDLFRLVARTQHDNVLGRVYAVVNADETWHVELGLAVVAHLAAAAGDVDLDAIARASEVVFATAPQANPSTLRFLCRHLGVDLATTRSYFAESHDRRLAQLEAATTNGRG